MPHPVIQVLRKVKSENKLSQRAIAHRVGVKQPTICRWLTGTRQPNSESVARLAQAFPELIPAAIESLLDQKESDGPD